MEEDIINPAKETEDCAKIQHNYHPLLSEDAQKAEIECPICGSFECEARSSIRKGFGEKKEAYIKIPLCISLCGNSVVEEWVGLCAKARRRMAASKPWPAGGHPGHCGICGVWSYDGENVHDKTCLHHEGDHPGNC